MMAGKPRWLPSLAPPRASAYWESAALSGGWCLGLRYIWRLATRRAGVESAWLGVHPYATRFIPPMVGITPPRFPRGYRFPVTPDEWLWRIPPRQADHHECIRYRRVPKLGGPVAL